ncbi:MAG: hypothetical protein AAGJ68_07590 [Pseudomonadota bacterium]
MSDATFETFLVSGLLVLIAAVAYLAWSAWRWVDRERDMEQLALVGVGHELRYNLQRMMGELARVSTGALRSDIEIVPVVHPQLDALLTRPNEADRMGLTNIRAHYNELSAHKLSLKAALKEQTDVELPANIAADAVIESLATLYLWEEHKGRAPENAHSTRSWAVRDWMKTNKFHADSLPGLHLRDQVVERLRRNGMTLTPKPLTYTASEYFAKQYDRKADPNAPFWKRKKKVVPVPVVEAEGETLDEAPMVEEEVASAPEPEMIAEEGVAVSEAELVSDQVSDADAPHESVSVEELLSEPEIEAELVSETDAAVESEPETDEESELAAAPADPEPESDAVSEMAPAPSEPVDLPEDPETMEATEPLANPMENELETEVESIEDVEPVEVSPDSSEDPKPINPGAVS